MKMWIDDLPPGSRKEALKAMEQRKRILSAWYRGDLGRELARRGIDVMNRRIERIVLAAND
jgi:hypothetical protein